MNTWQLVERVFGKVVSKGEIFDGTELSYRALVRMMQIEGNVYDPRTCRNYIQCAQDNGLIKPKAVDPKTEVEWSFFPQDRLFVLQKEAIDNLLKKKTQTTGTYINSLQGGIST